MAVFGGNRQRFTKAEGMELRRGFAALPFGLVDHQLHRLAQAPQVLGYLMVAAHGPVATVGEKQHAVGFLDGQARLRFGQRRQRVTGFGHQAAGIHHHESAPMVVAESVLPVAGEAREIRDQRIAGSGEAVEQGGLAHVRTPHQCEHRQGLGRCVHWF